MTKSQNFYNKPLNLLPHYFKKIGLVVIICSVLIPLCLKLFHIQMNVANSEMMKETIKKIIKDSIIIGLVFIAFSKDKIEDEMTMLLRIKALISGLSFAITFAIVSDIFNIFLHEPLKELVAFQIIFQTLIWNLGFYYLAKYFR